MPAFSKKLISEDEDSDDMGPSKQLLNKKPSTKKRKRQNTKQEEKEDESMNPDSASVVVPTITSPNMNEPEKKKLKKEKKAKQKATPKKKAPLDLDRQCGVLIAPSNNPCSRSLTCKIHAMGAKRAVEGRSQPFNELLAAYQKKGIGRPQVPGTINDKEGTRSKINVLDNQNKPPKIQSNNATHATKKSSQNVNNTTSTAATSNMNNISQSAMNNNNKEEDPDIDSDEETENVRLAIEQSKPMPLGTKQLFYVRRKRKYFKLRDILLEAITPKDNTTSISNHNTSTSSATSSTNLSAATSNNEVYSQGSVNQLSFYG